MIDLVVFDLDDTLYRERDYLKLVFNEFERAKNLKPTSLITAFDKLNRQDSKDLLMDSLKGIGLSTKTNHDILFRYYQKVSGNIELNRPIVSLIGDIRSLNLPVAILTNGTPSVQRNKIKLLKVHKYFDAIFIARELGEGLEKPASQVFQRVLDHFSVSAHRAVMIGDNIKNDINGAQSAGMYAFNYNVSWDHAESVLEKFRAKFLGMTD